MWHFWKVYLLNWKMSCSCPAFLAFRKAHALTGALATPWDTENQVSPQEWQADQCTRRSWEVPDKSVACHINPEQPAMMLHTCMRQTTTSCFSYCYFGLFIYSHKESLLIYNEIRKDCQVRVQWERGEGQGRNIGEHLHLKKFKNRES